MDFASAAAHNEEVFRSINERIDEGAKQHGVEQLLPFHCECATEVCVETIDLPPAEYDRIATHPARFVVVPELAKHVPRSSASTRGHAIKRDDCVNAPST